MLKISKRANQTIFSPIRKLAPVALAAEKRGIKILKVNLGDTNFLPPTIFLKTIKNYPDKNVPYAPSAGLAEYVSAWVNYYAKLGIKLTKEEIMPTIGGSEAMLFSLLATADAGDEIIVFEPVYPSYISLSAMLEIKLVPIRLHLENNFALPAASEIIKKITKKTKAIVVINPDNPSGKIWSGQELNTIADIAQKKNLFIIVDETYREIIFTGKPSSLLNLKKVASNVLMIDSASKKFALPGSRMGCLASHNPDIMASALKFSMARLSAPTIEQRALTPVLNREHAFVGQVKTEYKKRRDVVRAELLKIPGVKCNQPEGAMYIMAQLPVADAEKFARFMMEKFSDRGQTTWVTPAKDFYLSKNSGHNEIRLAYTLSTAELKRAVQIIGLGLSQYLKTTQ